MKYTVILLRPDDLADNYGQDACTLHVEATNGNGAIIEAQRATAKEDQYATPGNYYPIGVFHGWLDNVVND